MTKYCLLQCVFVNSLLTGDSLFLMTEYTLECINLCTWQMSYFHYRQGTVSTRSHGNSICPLFETLAGYVAVDTLFLANSGLPVSVHVIGADVLFLTFSFCGLLVNLGKKECSKVFWQSRLFHSCKAPPGVALTPL